MCFTLLTTPTIYRARTHIVIVNVYPFTDRVGIGPESSSHRFIYDYDRGTVAVVMIVNLPARSIPIFIARK